VLSVEGSGFRVRVEGSGLRVGQKGSLTALQPDQVFAEDVGIRGGGERRFIGFARVFSGTLRVGDEVLVLGPRYEYNGAGSSGAGEGAGEGGCQLPHAEKTRVTSLHLMMGRWVLTNTSMGRWVVD